MPFTVAHPAILLPLLKLPKHWFSWTALICGAIAPDFEYFIRLDAISTHTHEINLSFLYNIAIGLTLCFMYQGLIKNALIQNLPNQWKENLKFQDQTNWFSFFKKHYVRVIISIVIGALSHIFWDAFTHKGAYFVTKISWLASDVDLGYFTVPVYKLLQHASTLIGFSFIGKYVLNHVINPRTFWKQTFSNKKVNFFWLQVLIGGIAIWSLLLNRYTLSHFIISGISSMIISICAAATIFQLSHKIIS